MFELPAFMDCPFMTQTIQRTIINPMYVGVFSTYINFLRPHPVPCAPKVHQNQTNLPFIV